MPILASGEGAARNAPVYVTTRELARYFYAGVHRSLPALDVDAIEARRARGRRRQHTEGVR